MYIYVSSFVFCDPGSTPTSYVSLTVSFRWIVHDVNNGPTDLLDIWFGGTTH